MLSIFAAFQFQWPPALVSLYEKVSLASFNLELLAPECSFSVNYAAKWLVTEALPLILVASVLVVLVGTRALQFMQRKVFKVVPFGAAGEMNLVDVCIGILISGSYYLYFRTSCKCVLVLRCVMMCGLLSVNWRACLTRAIPLCVWVVCQLSYGRRWYHSAVRRAMECPH